MCRRRRLKRLGGRLWRRCKEGSELERKCRRESDFWAEEEREVHDDGAAKGWVRKFLERNGDERD